jgi:hypothetical protein
LKKFRGVFAKLPDAGYFYNYRIIFLLKILWNRSTVRWTESTVAGAWVHGLSLNESCRLANQQLRLKNCEGVSDNLIVAVNAEMDGSRRLDRQGRRDHGGTPGPRWQLTEISRYRHSSPPKSTRFSPTASWRHEELDSLTLGRQRMMMVVSDGEAVRLASGIDAGKLRCSSGEDEGTKGVAVFGDPFGIVDLARAAAHRRGGEIHTVARVLTIADQNSP